MIKCIDLQTPKQVMQAFLAGEKLQNSSYQDDSGDIFLYLSEEGFVCEEDGAGAKADRVPITMRNENTWRIIKVEHEEAIGISEHCLDYLKPPTKSSEAGDE